MAPVNKDTRLAEAVAVDGLGAVARREGMSRNGLKERLDRAGANVTPGAAHRRILAPTELVPDWPDAACVGTYPELFFPDVSDGEGAWKRARRQAGVACRVCAECPRRVECLERAVRLKMGEGVWGGVWFHNGKPQATK